MRSLLFNFIKDEDNRFNFHPSSFELYIKCC